jgi:hypothetical protein
MITLKKKNPSANKNRSMKPGLTTPCKSFLFFERKKNKHAIKQGIRSSRCFVMGLIIIVNVSDST